MGLGDFMSVIKPGGIFGNKKENKLKIKVVNKSDNELPSYATIGSAGMDVRSYITENKDRNIILEPGRRYMIHTGLYFKVPDGHEMQIRPRSGLAIKNGITIINSPGTLDSDYVEELCILMINHSDKSFIINNGDRIAQIVFNKYEIAEFELTDELSKTDRSGGFGSTGIK